MRPLICQLMIDKTPYIIVDNRKIAPIERSSRPDSAAVDHKGQEEQTFGVVDRVTLSSEAREKYRQHAIETDPPALEDPSLKPATSRPRLTHHPRSGGN
jgi:hypothetical protein